MNAGVRPGLSFTGAFRWGRRRAESLAFLAVLFFLGPLLLARTAVFGADAR